MSLDYNDCLSPDEIETALKRISENRPLANKGIWDIYPDFWKNCSCCFSKKMKTQKTTEKLNTNMKENLLARIAD